MSDKTTAAQEVEILAPDIMMVIAGREVKMREPSWVESLDIEAVIAPCVEYVRDLIEGSDIKPGKSEAFLKVLIAMMRKHKAEILEVMAFCAGVEREWIEKLNDSDGHKLMMLYWRVNWHFFVRRLNLLQALGGLSAQPVGATSSAH